MRFLSIAIGFLFSLSDGRLHSYFYSSLGTVALRGESYALSHRPFFLARSIASNPAAFISPLSMSAEAFSRLIFDHKLRSDRGTNLCSHVFSFSGFFCPSIHP